MYWKYFSLAQTLLLAGSVSGLVLAATPSQAQNDPPPGAASLSHLIGNVSIQSYGVDGWGQAYPNMPANTGDRIYADPQARGELDVSQVRAYFDHNADLTLIRNDFQGVELGIGQGSIYIYSDGFPPGAQLTVQTPNGAVTVGGNAGFRVDVYPDQQSTIVTNIPNRSQLSLNGGGGFFLTLPGNQSVQLAGTNPVYAQPLQMEPWDDFGHWAGSLNSHRLNAISLRYVSPEMPGYDDLDSAGDWQPQSDYGPIWFPHVQAGWAPYHYGHWVNRPFYGWTWVADEPWGAAPFHYGRWIAVGGRWGWVPGPREVHPLWSPAQVVFAGGVQVGGVGVSVWFPLGPGEPYKPWYPCSPTYINQINIVNIRPAPAVHVQTNYVNIVNVTNVTNITYINRTSVVAMNTNDFAAGRPVQTVAVKVAPQQIEHIQLAAPAARPPAQPVILHPIAKPAAVPQQRPVLINSKGMQAAAVPNAKPIPVAVKAAPPAPRPIPGHTAVGTPTLGGKPAPAPAKAAPEPAKPAAQPAPAPKTAATPEKPAAKPAVEPAKPAAAPAKPAPSPAKPAAEPAKPAAAPAKSATPEKPATAAKPPAPKPATQPAPKPSAPGAKPEARPVNPNEPKPANAPNKPGDKNANKKNEKKEDKKPPEEPK